MDGYRERVAAALEAADTDCHTGCQPDPERLADAVLAVRGEESQALMRAHVALASQAGSDQAAIARVRAVLDRYDWEVAGDRIPGRDILDALDGETPPEAPPVPQHGGNIGWSDPAEDGA